MSNADESQHGAPPGAQQEQPPVPAADPDAAAQALQARAADLEKQLEQLQAQHSALSAEHATLGAQHAALSTDHAALGTQHLAALRRALLAEHAGQVVPELIAGNTAEDLEASLDTARAAFTRATEAARAQLQAEAIPAGNPARGQDDLSALPATEKIARGLASR